MCLSICYILNKKKGKKAHRSFMSCSKAKTAIIKEGTQSVSLFTWAVTCHFTSPSLPVLCVLLSRFLTNTNDLYLSVISLRCPGRRAGPQWFESRHPTLTRPPRCFRPRHSQPIIRLLLRAALSQDWIISLFSPTDISRNPAGWRPFSRHLMSPVSH